VRRGVRTGFLLATVGAMSIGGTMVAYADWTVPSPAAKATVRAATVPRGVTPSAAVQGGNAVVSWSAQEIEPGLPMTGYVVTAHSVDATPSPDIARTVVGTGSSTGSAVFTGSELAGGKWKWAITPAFGSWTGPEGRLSGPKLSFPAKGHANAATGPVDAPAKVEPAPVPATTTQPATESTHAEPSPSTTAPSTPAPAVVTSTPPPSEEPETRMD
jgi:hypothetical protein